MKYPSKELYSNSWVVNDDLWTVKFVKRLIDDETGKPLFGLTDPSRMTIFISQKQSNAEILKTFHHEIKHAIEFSYDMGVDIKDKYTYKDFHDLIGVLETCESEFLRDNWDAYTCLLTGVRLYEKKDLPK